MPTVEFYGFGPESRREMQARVRELLASEPFRDQCVFVSAPASQVQDWSGRDRPFLRVSTRSADRAERFKVLLARVCDLEIVRIDFQQIQDEAPQQEDRP